jgi:DNA-binding CsgD family transcriptional regulator/tetratricopeptide (TPR) repeat protein
LLIKLASFFIVLFLFSGSILCQNEKPVSQILNELKSGIDNFQKAAIQYLNDEKNYVSDELISAIEKSIGNRNTNEFPELCFLMGSHFYNQNFNKCYYYFYKTLKSAKDLEDTTKAYLPKFHEKMGVTYFYFRRYKESHQHLISCLKFKNNPTGRLINVYNTLGLIYRNEGDDEESIKYIKKAYDIAVESKDLPWIGVLSGNLGHYAFTKKDYPKAKKLLTADYLISKETKQFDSELNALTDLIKIDIAENKMGDVREKVQELVSLYDSIATVDTKYSYFKTLSEYFENMNDYPRALKNYKLARAYADTISMNRDLLSIQNFEFQMDFEQKQTEIKVLQEKRKRDEVKQIALVVSLLLIGVISFLIIRQISNKRKQERVLHREQQEKVKQEIKSLESELHGILGKLIKKNAVIDRLKNEIETINSEKVSSLRQEKILESLQSFTLLTEEDWDTFKKLFEKLNPGFIQFIKLNYPEVTASETRLATLIRLNLSNSEMANALGISPDSVRKTNLRLRKKLGISSNDELFKFVANIKTT